MKRLVGKRYVTGRCLDVVEAACIYRRQNIQNRDAGGTSNNLPRIAPSANIQDCLARLVIGGEILEPFLLKIPPQRLLKLNWIHRGIRIVKEFPPFTLRRNALGWISSTPAFLCLMKIAIDVHSLGTQSGGNETYCRQLLRGLAQSPGTNQYDLLYTHSAARSQEGIGGPPF